MVWLPGVFILQDYIHGPSGIPVYHQDDIRFLTAQCDSGKLEATHFPTGNLGGSIPERTFTNLDFPERWELPFGGPGRVRSLWIIILDLFFVKHSLFTSTKTGTTSSWWKDRTSTTEMRAKPTNTTHMGIVFATMLGWLRDPFKGQMALHLAVIFSSKAMAPMSTLAMSTITKPAPLTKAVTGRVC